MERRSHNPTLSQDKFEAFGRETEQPMTLSGTIGKASILLAIVVGASVAGWYSQKIAFALGAIVIALVLAIVTAIKPQWSPLTAPVYALFQGFAVGVISYYSSVQLQERGWAGAVPMALAGTFVVFAVMFTLYSTRVIKVTETFRAVVVGATLAVGITYLATFAIGFFVPAVYNLAIYGSGPIGIGFSVVVIGLAAFNLALDFDTIENGVQYGAPKFMEWYAAFGLTVTIVWIYLEILRLMRKLAGR